MIGKDILAWIVPAAMLAGAGLVCGGAVLIEKKRPDRTYDERQRLHRGRAMTLGFYVGQLYSIAMAVWSLLAGGVPVEVHLVLGFGIVMQAMVVNTYLVMTDSAVGPKEHPNSMSVAYMAMGAMQLVNFMKRSSGVELSFTGEGAKLWWNLLMAVTFLYLGIVHQVGRWWHNRE